MTNPHMVEFIEGAPVWHPYQIADRGHGGPCVTCGKVIKPSWKRYVVPRVGLMHVYCQYVGDSETAVT